MYTDDNRTIAASRVRFRACLAQLATIWVLAAAFFTAVWATGNRGFFWPVWPLGFAAIGMLLHLATLVPPRRSFEDRVDREVERMARR